MHKGILLPLALAVVLPLTAQESNHLAPAAATHAENIAPQQTDAVPPRPEGSIYMGGFRAPKIENVRVAMIGLGERGLPQTIQMTAVPHCEVVAVCDLYDDLATKTADIVEKAGSKRPAVYSGDKDAYLRMLEEVKPDAVIISTNWETHAQIAIDAMEHGAHAFVEVPLAITIKDLWRVVDTAERTKKHCMMLENVNYGRDELMFLNMVQHGGHGGMDYIMLYRAIECLHKGEPMDQNVYEGALWSAVSPLSEKSVHEGGAPQIFPDFTRGDWKTTEPLGIVD